MIKNFYKNKKVFITGCTGFTGSWLVLYFKLKGAKIYGYSKKPPFKNSLFQKLQLNKKMIFREGNVENFIKFQNFFNKTNPDFVFHLAANPIVKDCYDNPLDAFHSNSIGTLNLLEIVRKNNKKKRVSLNIITTDKVYKNDNKKKKFKENDNLGGDEPYSVSKICAELITNTYFKTYFKKKNININILRSGNIIGGGDWSNNRLIPDIIKSVYNKKKLIIRNPSHIRPWQHIFDVINAYSIIAEKTYMHKNKNLRKWNIGPLKEKSYSVKNIITLILKKLNKKSNFEINKSYFKEKKNLELNSFKLKNELGFINSIKTNEAINLTAEWYLNFYGKNKRNFSNAQLINFLNDKN